MENSEQFEKDLKRLEILREQLENDGWLHLRVVEGRGICGFCPFIYTMGLCYGVDNVGWFGRWCYPHAEAYNAYLAFAVWDGKEDPLGKWVKYKGRDAEYENPKLQENHV